MNPYDIVMQHLRDAGFNYDALADLTARNALPVQVINVRRDSKDGRVLFTQHTAGNTVVVFQGLHGILPGTGDYETAEQAAYRQGRDRAPVNNPTSLERPA